MRLQPLKLLVFEYITGGGFAGQPMPLSLQREGLTMLQALLDELSALSDIRVSVLIDERCAGSISPGSADLTVVAAQDDIRQVLRQSLTRCDAILPIAPETAGVLSDIAKTARELGKRLLLSAPETVDICADKLATYRCLKSNGIPVVETLSLSCVTEAPFEQSVIKPIDGVGCEGNRIAKNRNEFKQIADSLDWSDRYAVQALTEGAAASLSILCKQGRAWLLSYNRQHLSRESGRFELLACSVNAPNPDLAGYAKLASRIALALPELWGYIGIDVLETGDRGAVVLEINPRLTTSYAGIRPATGINVAEQVIRLLNGDPELVLSHDRTIEIKIH